MATKSPNSNSTSGYKPTIIQNRDGTYTRLIQLPLVPPTPQHDLTTPSPHVLTKDIPVNPTNKTWLRLYLPPHQSLTTRTNSNNKLPLIIYFHGGAFVFLSAGTSIMNDFCVSLAIKLNCIVASVDYRLAPEHRLPAAYDDAIEALRCLATCKDDWLMQFCDFTNCFLMGSSAGGNIAFHAGLRLVADNFEPLKINGLILHHPFFGGLGRTRSEMENVNDVFLTLAGCDHMWELALPIGADRDHRFCNPVSWFGSHNITAIESVRVVGTRVLVTGCFEDPLIDRQVEFARMLKEKGVECVAHFSQGYHCVEISEPSKAETLISVIKDFMA